ncbi:MAG: mannose-1-phosphate guanylyltransferase, partial [Pseudoruegeria sp.]
MITPVLLCGGSGTRLWPLSRKSYPKQFLPLLGKESLFQTTLQRLRGANFSEPIILTGADMRFIVAEQMLDIGCLNSTVLVEPEGRNTAPAVLAAALHLEAIDPDDVMIIAPSDHQISDVAVFQKVVAQAEGIARSGKIVTLGILPDRPETGYGWLELSEVGERGPQPLCGFVEKPTEALAKSMLHGGRYLWNAGIFICSVRVLLEAYRKHAPEMIPPIQAAVRNADYSPEFHFLDATSWDKVEAISLDSAIM